jgi:hypothetical protein
MTTEITTTTIVASLPSNVTEIVNKAGKVTGQKFKFGALTFAEVKAACPATMTNAQKKDYAAKVLSDESTQREFCAMQMVRANHAAGYIFDEANMRKTGSDMKFVKATSTEDTAKAARAELAESRAKLEAQAAEIADMRRMLEEMRAADRQGNRDAKSGK